MAPICTAAGSMCRTLRSSTRPTSRNWRLPQGAEGRSRQADVKLTFMPFLMKAVCKALANYPQFNSSLSADGEKLILKKYVNIGVAVDAEWAWSCRWSAMWTEGSSISRATSAS